MVANIFLIVHKFHDLVSQQDRYALLLHRGRGIKIISQKKPIAKSQIFSNFSDNFRPKK